MFITITYLHVYSCDSSVHTHIHFQGARILYEREAQIVINYSKLDEKLKRVHTAHVHFNISVVYTYVCTYVHVCIRSFYL